MPTIRMEEIPVEPSALAKQITSDLKQIGLQLGRGVYGDSGRDEPFDRTVRVMETLIAKECYSPTAMPWLYHNPADVLDGTSDEE